jgi:hypothetical protein
MLCFLQRKCLVIHDADITPIRLDYVKTRISGRCIWTILWDTVIITHSITVSQLQHPHTLSRALEHLAPSVTPHIPSQAENILHHLTIIPTRRSNLEVPRRLHYQEGVIFLPISTQYQPPGTSTRSDNVHFVLRLRRLTLRCWCWPPAGDAYTLKTNVCIVGTYVGTYVLRLRVRMRACLQHVSCST